MDHHTIDFFSELACQFLAELLVETGDAPTPALHRKQLQAFINELRPWVDPSDLPSPPRRVFTLFENLDFDEDNGDMVWGTFTPEGLALFRAWLRRHGVDPMLCSS